VHHKKWESVETRYAQTATLSFSIFRDVQIAVSKAVKVKAILLWIRKLNPRTGTPANFHQADKAQALPFLNKIIIRKHAWRFIFLRLLQTSSSLPFSRELENELNHNWSSILWFASCRLAPSLSLAST